MKYRSNLAHRHYTGLLQVCLELNLKIFIVKVPNIGDGRRVSLNFNVIYENAKEKNFLSSFEEPHEYIYVSKLMEK